MDNRVLRGQADLELPMRVIAVSLLLAAAAAQAAPLSTAFTYQGDLHDGGLPANGLYDLRITAWDGAGGGATLGPPVVVQDVPVIAGVFTAQLDFGKNFFVGDAVFLEIAVREGSSVDDNAYETLAPRQELTAAPYALKTAPGSVTDIELASDAVGNAQVQPSAIASAEVANGSLLPEDLAPAAFDGTFWGVAGNTALPAGSFLGTTDNTRLALRSPVGVTINGSALNNSTELTVRGNSAAADTNADITLWPRGGEFFWDFAASGTTELDSRLGIYSVDTNPFGGFQQRFAITSFGSTLVGNGANSAHVGSFAFADASGGSFATTGINQFIARATGGVGINGAPLSSDYELSLSGSASAATDDVEIAMRPDAPDQGRVWAMRTSKGSGQTQVSFDYTSPPQAVVAAPYLVLTGLGSIGIGGAANPAHGGSFVFADGNSASELATTAANQFVLRAHGGVGINRPALAGEEVAIGPREGESNNITDVAIGAPGTVGNFRISTSTAGAGSTIGRFMLRNTNASFANSPVLEIFTEGTVRRLGLFRGAADGSWVSPGHPLEVGIGTVANSGNGAHVTVGGVWTNGSSRTFKHAFTGIDPADILRRVLALDVGKWQYKTEENIWHLGPIAEDFHAAFGLGGDDRYIGTVDADGVALAAIQGLAAENARLRRTVEGLERRLQVLEAAAQ
jgi:hypothetical protein